MTNAHSDDKVDKRQMGQLERGLAAIHALVNTLQPMKLTALAEITGLDPSGTLRLLKTLSDLGYVTRDDARKVYLPGAKALMPLGQAHPLSELRRDAADVLFALQRETSAATALQVFLGESRVVVEQRHGSSRLSPFWDPVLKSALHSSASGKLLLSTFPKAEWYTLLGPAPYERFTPRTLTTQEQVEADIERSLVRGYFAVQEEVVPGMCSLAAPIRIPNGDVIGCLVAHGSTVQLVAARLDDYGVALRRAAEMLSTMSPAVRALEHLMGRGLRNGAAGRENNTPDEAKATTTATVQTPNAKKAQANRKAAGFQSR